LSPARGGEEEAVAGGTARARRVDAGGGIEESAF